METITTTENVTIKIPDNVPVSFLERLTNFSPEVLMLASEPNENTETQYMSKYFTYSQLANQLSLDFGLGYLSTQIDNLWEQKADISSFKSNTLYCNTTSPYIISAISQKNGNITSLAGYRLQDGMYTVFNQASVKSNLKSVIPSLTSTTKAASAGNIITSVTTENGQVKSVGTISYAAVAAEASKVYIKHIEGGALSWNFTNADKTDLSIMRLTESQLASLKSGGHITRNVIYMTT